MQNKLIVIISGKKQSGKTSLGKFIFTEFVNHKIGRKRLEIEKFGKDVFVIDTFNNKKITIDSPGGDINTFASTYSVKLYSFADPLKEFCINTLGLDHEQCYGSDDDKNSHTHIPWSGIPLEVRKKYAKIKKTGEMKLPNGNISARNIMEIVGTDFMRQMDPNCWSRSTLNKIEKDNYDLSIILDARFPNEVSMGMEIGAKSIRLLRNTGKSMTIPEIALDNFPHGEYSLVYDNQKKTMQDSHRDIKKTVLKWFDLHNL